MDEKKALFYQLIIGDIFTIKVGKDERTVTLLKLADVDTDSCLPEPPNCINLDNLHYWTIGSNIPCKIIKSRLDYLSE